MHSNINTTLSRALAWNMTKCQINKLFTSSRLRTCTALVQILLLTLVFRHLTTCLAKVRAECCMYHRLTTAAQLQLTTATATNTTSSAFFPPRPSWQVQARHAAAPPTTVKHLNWGLGSSKRCLTIFSIIQEYDIMFREDRVSTYAQRIFTELTRHLNKWKVVQLKIGSLSARTFINSDI